MVLLTVEGAWLYSQLRHEGQRSGVSLLTVTTSVTAACRHALWHLMAESLTLTLLNYRLDSNDFSLRSDHLRKLTLICFPEKWNTETKFIKWPDISWTYSPNPLKMESNWKLTANDDHRVFISQLTDLTCIAHSSDCKGHQSSAAFSRDTGRLSEVRQGRDSPRDRQSVRFSAAFSLSHSQRVKAEVWWCPWIAPAILTTCQTLYFTVGPPHPRAQTLIGAADSGVKADCPSETVKQVMLWVTSVNQDLAQNRYWKNKFWCDQNYICIFF